MRSSNLLLVVLMMAGVLLVSASASATIVNMSTGQTLFYDNFEGMGTNVSHGEYVADESSYNPTGGSPGSWAITEAIPNRIQVTDATGTNGPGTLQGNNYLRIVRTGAETDPMAAQNFTDQTTTGDHIHFEQMLYVPDLASTNPVQFLGNGGSRFNILTSYNGGGGTIGSYLADGNFPGPAVPLTYVAGKWQKWELDYNIGDSFLKMSIDGVSASNVPIIAGGSLSSITIDCGSAVYADEVAVPEPCTLALLTAGVFGLLAYAWRKRK
jgi:hypothetical protein